MTISKWSYIFGLFDGSTARRFSPRAAWARWRDDRAHAKQRAEMTRTIARWREGRLVEIVRGASLPEARVVSSR